MDRKLIGSADEPALVNLAALIIIFAGVIFAKSIVTPFLLALFISIICVQPISWLEKKRVPRRLALFIVILGLLLLFSGFSFLIGGTISSFTGNLQKYNSALTDIGNTFIQYLNDKGLNIPVDQISNLIHPEKILQYTATAMTALLNMMGTLFIIFLIILFTLTEYWSFSVKAKAILSESGGSISYFSTILQNIRHYLAIKTLLSLSIGVLIYVALQIIGVEYPLLWALIGGLMNYIPNLGSIISTIPTVLFALIQLGLGGALWTLFATMVIHNALGNFIEPRVMGRGLGLSTLVVFVSLLFWGFILGPVGMFLSVPLTMTIKIILEQNEKTQWLAILLGTPSEAKIYLQNRNLAEEKQKKSHAKVNEV
jgi:predicted PurR-regulated permease PerM